ncbi:MAG: oxidoreductase [Halieaceae bacterium]|nr:oxidoreductase [Halieaceae bacterium]
MTEATRTWLITGCSTGFGREMAMAVLAAGDNVVVTARSLAAVADILDRYPETAAGAHLDVTDAEQREAALAVALNRFGGLDVLVNNAGYGYLAAIEEGDEDEIRQMFETNFFGALALTKLALPHFRQRRAGLIINNSSQAGLMGNPGTGYYSASKFALEGAMEALTRELEPLGIKVVSLQPGAFRTDWSGRSMRTSGTRIADYAGHVGARIDMISQIDGQQPGDPKRVGPLVVELSRMAQPPEKLLLGAGLYSTYEAKLVQRLEDMRAWREVTESVDFPTDATPHQTQDKDGAPHE